MSIKTIKTASELKYGELFSEYNSYRAARHRCSSPNASDYKYYGGRGIEFRFSSFAEFMKELGRKPSPKYTVDRIDVNGHYEAGNVEWKTRRDQANNTRTNHSITADGETLTVAEWSRRTGIKRRNIHFRERAGWCINCILSNDTPTCIHGYDRNRNVIISANQRNNTRLITIQNKTLSATQWSKRTGTKYTTILRRIDRYGFCEFCAVNLPAGEKCVHKKFST